MWLPKLMSFKRTIQLSNTQLLRMVPLQTEIESQPGKVECFMLDFTSPAFPAQIECIGLARITSEICPNYLQLQNMLWFLIWAFSFLIVDGGRSIVLNPSNSKMMWFALEGFCAKEWMQQSTGRWQRLLALRPISQLQECQSNHLEFHRF